MTSPEQVFLTHLSMIDTLVQMVARQQRMTWAEAEEFGSIVRLRLIENDYAVIRKFRGGSSLRTYLTVVIARQGLDYRDACWGRWRPSRGARRLGSTAVALEKMIVRDGLSPDEAFAALPAADVERDGAQLRAFAANLSPRVRRNWLPIEDVEECGAVAMQPDVDAAMHGDRGVAKALARALKNLSPSDSRLLKLRFSNGMSISSIARNEGLDQASLYSRVSGLLRRMRRELEDGGVAAPAH